MNVRPLSINTLVKIDEISFYWVTKTGKCHNSRFTKNALATSMRFKFTCKAASRMRLNIVMDEVICSLKICRTILAKSSGIFPNSQIYFFPIIVWLKLMVTVIAFSGGMLWQRMATCWAMSAKGLETTTIYTMLYPIFDSCKQSKS